MLNYDYKPEFIVDKYNPLTLHRVIVEKSTHLDPILREEFADLISCIARSCKLINYHLRQAGLSNLYGNEEGENTENASGEKRKKIDVISNDILKQQLTSLATVGFRVYDLGCWCSF
jgi:fructose-1,6-bisphosphatase